MRNALHSLISIKDGSSEPKRFNIFPDYTVDVYPLSIHHLDEADFFIGVKEGVKYLFAAAAEPPYFFGNFKSEVITRKGNQGPLTVIRCGLIHENAVMIRELFEYTRPRLIGIKNSFGLGDRIGLANAGHLRAVRNSGFEPVLAQQSIRELTRTNRSPEEVMDAATWAVFQEGYKGGFGADADHLKTTDDIDLMMKAGFTMFTIDPSDYVVNEAGLMSEDELIKRSADVLWGDLHDDFEGLVKRYKDKSLSVDESFALLPTYAEILRAVVKYGNVLAHVFRMSDYLKNRYPDKPSEIEVSVDETDSPTTLFEHYFIANELKRLGVGLVSLAPRFIGDFEKGVDYRGDIKAFTGEYEKHLAIAESLGPYKLSIHSGSDKLSVYKAVGSIGKGHVHVKTAGTSYLEALRVAAFKDPELFRAVFKFSSEHFEDEKKTYHVSGSLKNVPDLRTLNDDELAGLFDNDDARQVLHVAFGKVLTVTDEKGKYVFKSKLIDCLNENESLHYHFIMEHFLRHIKPFGKQDFGTPR